MVYSFFLVFCFLLHCLILFLLFFPFLYIAFGLVDTCMYSGTLCFQRNAELSDSLGITFDVRAKRLCKWAYHSAYELVVYERILTNHVRVCLSVSRLLGVRHANMERVCVSVC